MGLEQKLSLKLSQRLVMTPTLQQAIKLLQMTRLELQDVVNQEIVANPVLEEEDDTQETAANDGGETGDGSESGEGGERGEGGEPAERAETLVDQADAREAGNGAETGPDEAGSETTDSLSSQPDPGSGSGTEPASLETPADGTSTALGDDSFGQIDLEAYFGEYMDGTATAPRMTEEGEEFSLENRAEAPPGLDAHLAEQLGVSGASGPVRDACAWLIGNVDADGYLRVTMEEVVAGVPCTPECAARALDLLQSFDPAGVGARSLSECLLIQARAAGVSSPLIEELVATRFTDLGTKSVAVLARQMGLPSEELQHAVDIIKKLDPRPGRRYDASRTIYVEPDVTVVKVDDEYVVLFNDDGLPRLKVSSYYRRLLLSGDGALDGDGKSYLREKMRAAQWLMKSLDQRKRTIVRVAESIVRKQREYFEYGVPHLRPLVLRDVAEDIGMHESTVSRVVSNKWMASPRGLLPMKFFFHSAIASSEGDDVSSLAVKRMIRALIEAEDTAHPLSDARLSELLSRDGIRIARRTVAKYREELRIPSSSVRRTETNGTLPSGGAGVTPSVNGREEAQ